MSLNERLIHGKITPLLILDEKGHIGSLIKKPLKDLHVHKGPVIADKQIGGGICAHFYRIRVISVKTNKPFSRYSFHS